MYTQAGHLRLWIAEAAVNSVYSWSALPSHPPSSRHVSGLSGHVSRAMWDTLNTGLDSHKPWNSWFLGGWVTLCWMFELCELWVPPLCLMKFILWNLKLCSRFSTCNRVKFLFYSCVGIWTRLRAKPYNLFMDNEYLCVISKSTSKIAFQV